MAKLIMWQGGAAAAAFVAWGGSCSFPVLSEHHAGLRLPHPSLCAWPWLVRAPGPTGSPFSRCLSLCSSSECMFSSLLDSVLKCESAVLHFYCVLQGVGPFYPEWAWGRWDVRGADTTGMETL